VTPKTGIMPAALPFFWLWGEVDKQPLPLTKGKGIKGIGLLKRGDDSL